jgi:hypothetical protein
VNAGGAGGAGSEIFRFEGDFAAVPIDWLTGEVRQRMEVAPVEPRARARLFASFVEMTQNIIRYAEPAGGEGGARRAGAVALGRDQAGWWVFSSNPVGGAHAARLRERLERIQAMGPEELKAAYQDRLGQGMGRAVDPLSRGAGLGLLSIARTAGGAFTYRLDPPAPGGGAYTFSLRAMVQVTGAPR